MSELLPQIFVLGRLGPGRCVFRLAGGLLADLHQRDLRQRDWLELWDTGARMQLAVALENARRLSEPVVVTAEARTIEGRRAAIEIFAAPLRAAAGQPDRYIGLYQPTSPLAALLGAPIHSLSATRVTAAGQPAEPYLKLAAIDGRRVA